MSRIDDMIAKLCPEGVEFKKVYEITNVINAPKKIKREDYTQNGLYAIIDQSQEFIAGYTNDDVLLVPDGEYVVFGEHTCITKFINFSFAQGADGIKILCAVKELLPKYLYYSISNLKISSRGYNRHWSVLKEIKIPIPPLSIQQEIVKVLDVFTELEARRKQYSYYRNKLLSFNDDTEVASWKTMSEIGTFVRGNGLQKKDFTDIGVGCIHYGQIYTYYGTFADKTKSFVSESLAKKMRKAHTGDLIIATTSENDEDVCKALAWLGKDEIAISGDAYIYRHSLHPKYAAYFFQTEQFQKQKKRHISGTKVKRVSGDSMKKFLIPVPPMEEQERIVSILDKFDTLVSDISVGLPAEISARHKQYEHYRNRLLTFQEAAR
ncbi:restriction endonuclease subunit S [Candidatus Trichorickettsia mobilis]|uniref:restriction endonuclease subunit S n=1 Tax=Candidatus Trichorickettsia mobilis TaxID=1346319 RepID=UPI00292E3F32|nr:restriction endonuclease subunit S [Candidatus Trichorickettsia mobilis]